MLECESKRLSEGQHWFRPMQAGKAMACGLVYDRWSRDQEFRKGFVELLRASSFVAYRWETPPVTRSTIDQDFEFVLIECPSLVRNTDVTAFEPHFRRSESVVVFENLGRDATLIVPTPHEPRTCYCDLASFVRHGPRQQVEQVWNRVGAEMNLRVKELAEGPIWLNTAGMGIAYLHIRLDTYPKYYAYQPYRKMS